MPSSCVIAVGAKYACKCITMTVILITMVLKVTPMGPLYIHTCTSLTWDFLIDTNSHAKRRSWWGICAHTPNFIVHIVEISVKVFDIVTKLYVSKLTIFIWTHIGWSSFPIETFYSITHNNNKSVKYSGIFSSNNWKYF